ncbi:MAG: PHP domain-containing protein [Erysipelotrichaceae bacterium]|nr:PHP domain-containing protein [Erysipelotrichaceae bacterium]
METAKQLIDMHMHTIYSIDGEYTPKQLLKLCNKVGYKYISITDHNSIRGSLEAIKLSKEYDMNVISGIELDCNINGIDLHLLGYDFKGNTDPFLKIENEVLTLERNRANKLLDNAYNILKLQFDEEKAYVEGHKGIVTGESIAEASLNDPRNDDNEFLKPYRKNQKRSDNPYVNFYWDYFSQGKICNVPIEFMSFDEANKIILDAQGVSIIAHPSITVKRNEDVIKYMIDNGVSGIEVYSSYHNNDDIEYYKNLSTNFNVLQSIGTDFHGKTKPSIALGSIIQKETQDKLIEFFEKRK